MKKLKDKGLIETFTSHKDPNGNYFELARFTYWRMAQVYLDTLK